jgi:MoaA/NifB/PqqE/SkfB family radical SAM enzyme
MTLRAHIQEMRGIATKLSYKKLKNAVDVYQSYQQAKKTKEVRHPAMPFALSVEPTTSCNLRCPECISGLRDFTRPTGMLELDLYKKIISEVKNHVIYLTLYFQGEPYLNRHFFDFARIAHDAGIYTNTSTNAHYFDEENARKTVECGLDRVIVSIDGLDQQTYEKYRIGGKLNKVTAGIRNLVEMKKKLKSRTPFIDLQFIAMGTNEHQLQDVELPSSSSV